jgi:pyrimidine deaminase RibD-like protein
LDVAKRLEMILYDLFESDGKVSVNYDQVLVDLCELIIKNKRKDPENGLVGASVISGNRRADATTGHFEGKMVHAERGALNAFEQKYGEIPDDAVIVTTLSPCVNDMPDRQGISCNELIDTTPVRVVYCGYRDPEHQEITHNDFDIRFTGNQEIEKMCKQFADMFQKQDLREGTDTDLKNKGNAFVKFAKQQLKIKQLPKIHMVSEIGSSEHPTFGLFDPNTNTIKVAYRARHIMDVLRTLAHELTHHKQREENRIKPGDGDTGSEIENEANAQAGVLMRDFADQNPDLFELKDPPVKRSWDDYGQPAAPTKKKSDEKVYHSWQHYDSEENKNSKPDNKSRLPVRN